MTNANGIAAFALDGLPPIGSARPCSPQRVSTGLAVRSLELRHRRPEQHVVANGSAARCERQRHRIPSKQGPGALVQGAGPRQQPGQRHALRSACRLRPRRLQRHPGRLHRITKGANPQQGPNLALERPRASTARRRRSTSSTRRSTTRPRGTRRTGIPRSTTRSSARRSGLRRSGRPTEWSASTFSPDASGRRRSGRRRSGRRRSGRRRSGRRRSGRRASGRRRSGRARTRPTRRTFSAPRPQACSPSRRHPARVTRASP